MFTCRDELRRAAQALNDNPANATQKYGPVETWGVSSITNMRGLFRGLKDFNSDVSSWSTSGVTDMSHMFEVRSDAPLYTLTHTLHPTTRAPRAASFLSLPLSILPRAPLRVPSARLGTGRGEV